VEAKLKLPLYKEKLVDHLLKLTTISDTDRMSKRYIRALSIPFGIFLVNIIGPTSKPKFHYFRRRFSYGHVILLKVMILSLFLKATDLS